MSRRFGLTGPLLHGAGWDVIPVKAREKFPVLKNWQEGFTSEQIGAFATNGSADSSIGLLSAHFPGVDIDVLDRDCADAIERFALDFFGPAPIRYGNAPKRLLMYRTEVPFSKAKIFLTDPQGNYQGADGKDFAVEVLGNGQQYLIYGEHPNGYEYLWPNADGPGDRAPSSLTTISVASVNAWLEALPIYLPTGWGVRVSTSAGQDVEEPESALALYKAPLEGWGAARILDEIAPYLDVEMHYDHWLKVGQALHHQFSGAAEGLALWEQLFSGSGKHRSGVAEKKWDSFSASRPKKHGPLTLATLIKETKAARESTQAAVATQAMETAKAAIAACTNDVDLRSKVAKEIQIDRHLDKNQREILVQAFNAKHKELSGAKLQVKDVRELLGVNGKQNAPQTSANMPGWAKPWVYVTDCDKFLNLHSKEEITRQGFKSKFNRFMGLNAFGARLQADQSALEDWDMPTVAHKAYMPAASAVFTLFGLQWGNLYRVESVPEMPEVLTPEHQKAIGLVLRHLELYLPDERERGLFLSWVAHNVQHPGIKVRWSPYLYGPPGDGKSFFGELIGHLLGGQNVRSLNGSTLESNFTDWAMGYAVTIVEEMKQHGHNRHDVMNKIKPFITNTEVEIHPKGRPSYSAPNSTNYLLLSNYLDGAPVEDSDRRYMFLSSALTKDEAKRLSEIGYFAQLFGAVQNNAGALRKHFLTLGMHPEFDANGRAPFTAAKATVIEISKSDLEMAVEELVDRGAVGVCREVISSAHLTRALKARLDEPLNTNRVQRLLSLKGYAFLTRKWWNGEACRIWEQQGLRLSAEQGLERLNQTLGADFLGQNHDI